MRHDKVGCSVGFAVVAAATISCTAPQDVTTPREMPKSTSTLVSEPRATEGAAIHAPVVTETSRETGQVGSTASLGCSNARPSLKERFRAWKLRHQEAWLGYPDEFCEKPLGSYVNDAIDKQRINGEAALMVLHHQDFGSGSNAEKLNDKGREELTRIAGLLPKNFAPVIIERSADVELDERRRQFILSELSSGPFPVPEERVIIGRPIATGMDGVEAGLVNLNLLKQTQARGQRDSVTGAVTGAPGTRSASSGLR